MKKIFLSAFVFLAVNFSLFAYDSVVALSRSCAQMWLLSGGVLSGCTKDALDLFEENSEFSKHSKPSVVGTLTSTSLEAVLSLNPDFVILTNDIPVHKSIFQNLKSFGIKAYVADINNFSDYAHVMKDFTSLTKRADLYEKNVLSVKKEIDSICSGAKEKKGRYLFLRVSSYKNKVLKEHFGNEIFEDLGLESIAKDKSVLDSMSMEAITNADPDYIFLVAQGEQGRADESFKKEYSSNPSWKNLSAVKNGNVFMLPKELFNYKPNADWAEAYRYAYEIIYK